jgi:hypothetical protein
MQQLQPPQQRQHHHFPHYHHQHRHGTQQQPSEWSSADPPSDGDAESPSVGEATRTQNLPSMMAPSSDQQHDLTSETEIQSGRVVWRRGPPILPPPIPSLSSAPHFLGSTPRSLLPSWPSMGTYSPAFGQHQLHLPPPSDALHF